MLILVFVEKVQLYDYVKFLTRIDWRFVGVIFTGRSDEMLLFLEEWELNTPTDLGTVDWDPSTLAVVK